VQLTDVQARGSSSIVALILEPAATTIVMQLINLRARGSTSVVARPIQDPDISEAEVMRRVPLEMVRMMREVVALLIPTMREAPAAVEPWRLSDD
jgi:hypothetical protein